MPYQACRTRQRTKVGRETMPSNRHYGAFFPQTRQRGQWGLVITFDPHPKMRCWESGRMALTDKRVWNPASLKTKHSFQPPSILTLSSGSSERLPPSSRRSFDHFFIHFWLLRLPQTSNSEHRNIHAETYIPRFLTLAFSGHLKLHQYHEDTSFLGDSSYAVRVLGFRRGVPEH